MPVITVECLDVCLRHRTLYTDRCATALRALWHRVGGAYHVLPERVVAPARLTLGLIAGHDRSQIVVRHVVPQRIDALRRQLLERKALLLTATGPLGAEPAAERFVGELELEAEERRAGSHAETAREMVPVPPRARDCQHLQILVVQVGADRRLGGRSAARLSFRTAGVAREAPAFFAALQFGAT